MLLGAFANFKKITVTLLLVICLPNSLSLDIRGKMLLFLGNTLNYIKTASISTLQTLNTASFSVPQQTCKLHCSFWIQGSHPSLGPGL